MARAKKTAAVEVPAETIEQETPTIQAVDLDAWVAEAVEAKPDHTDAIKLLIAELEYESAKLGHIGHLYYAKKVGERIAEISQTLKTLL